MLTTMKPSMKTNKVLVAMSGGVDSSVAALLCREAGYACVGVTMRLRAPDGSDPSCCTTRDIEDARRVASALGIPHEVCDLAADFDREVISHFVAAYENGLTPNPCIDCNRRIKFDALMRYAEKMGCEYVATGHYARLGKTPEGIYTLKRAANLMKDQSYVLYSLTQQQLSHILFPLGGFTSKDQIRALAEARGLSVADKADSQDICFVPDGDYAAFIETYTGRPYPAGDFVDEDGKVLGRHKGLIRYTVGQRRGLGLSLPASLYVKSKDPAANTVTLAPEEHLYSASLIADDFSWCAGEPPASPLHITAKTRYNAKDTPAVAELLPGGRVRICFDTPVRAVTAGQAVVLYDGVLVLGGGTIVSAEPS